MPKSPAPSPTDSDGLRLGLELLKRIPRQRSVSAAELQAQLRDAGIVRDVRTIQRQLETLSTQFDIDRDMRSKPYGYRWKPEARGLSVPGLTEPEALLLALARQHLSSLLPAQVTQALAPFFAQADSLLSPVRGGAARAWLDKVRVVRDAQPLMAPAVDPEVFAAVSRALYHDRWLEVDYRNAAGRTMTRRVMPLGLAQQAERLYLVCRFDGYEQERSLALHRMGAAREQATTFKRPKDFDLGQYDDDGRFGFGEGRRIALRFWIEHDAGRHLLESALSPDQQMSARAKGWDVRATVVDSGQLRWWLRGFGRRVRVIEPKGLLDQ